MIRMHASNYNIMKSQKSQHLKTTKRFNMIANDIKCTALYKNLDSSILNTLYTYARNITKISI